MKRRFKSAAAVAAILVSAVAAAEARYETAGTVAAEHYLPAGLMRGEEWRVEPQAVNDGFTNTYTVTSRFGRWEARGRIRVDQRVREVRALAELEQVSKTDVFLDAVQSSVTAPLKLVGSVAERPVETLKGIPSGVGRWFQKTRFKVQETYQDAKEAQEKRRVEQGEEGAAKGDEGKEDLKERAQGEARDYALGYLKISGAERRWYAELGVDPYTDNQVLRDAVTSVARVEGLTKFGMKFTGLPSIPGSRELRKTLDLVWKTDPWELRLRNRKMLLGAGVSEAVARQYEDNSAMSLTLQTAFLDTLSALQGVAGREHLLARALDVDTRPDAETLVAATGLLESFHRQEARLTAFLEGTRLPVARTEDGRLVAVVLADAVFWTEEIADAARQFRDACADIPARERVFLVAGEVSAPTKEGLAQLGWTVRGHWQAPGADQGEAGGR